ncbi:MAG: HYR domain-containing protein, partial [Candidatus Moranbacteria bacterium]|nr:HYR domain-containing protein [Candidatus Moranbacteria bacterium]
MAYEENIIRHIPSISGFSSTSPANRLSLWVKNGSAIISPCLKVKSLLSRNYKRSLSVLCDYSLFCNMLLVFALVVLYTPRALGHQFSANCASIISDCVSSNLIFADNSGFNHKLNLIRVKENFLLEWEQAMPIDLTVECDSIPDAPELISASSGCAGEITITFNEEVTPGSCPGNFIITRTWTATDNCGNSITHVQEITVQDTTSPTITFCPNPLDPFVNDPGLCYGSLSFEALAIDNCSDVSIVYSIGGSEISLSYEFPVGVTPVVITATDECGNAALCTFN